MSIAHDQVITLPSGTELDVASALGDLERARSCLAALHATNTDGLIADLEHVGELITVLAGEFPGEPS